MKHILNSTKVNVAESNRLLEDSDSSSEGSNTIIPIKRLQCKRSYVDPEDSVNFLDYSGQSEDQDEGDACGASQLKQTSVEFFQIVWNLIKLNPLLYINLHYLSLSLI